MGVNEYLRESIGVYECLWVIGVFLFGCLWAFMRF